MYMVFIFIFTTEGFFEVAVERFHFGFCLFQSLRLCIHIHINISIYLYIYTRLYIHIYIYKRLYIFVNIYIYMYIYMYIHYIYIYSKEGTKKNYKFAVTLSFMLKQFSNCFTFFYNTVTRM